MPGKAKWKWQWIDCNTIPLSPLTLCRHHNGPPRLPHCRRRHHDAFQLGALHYLCSLLGGRCLRGCLLIAHVLHDWATLWPTTYHPAPPLGTTLLLCQPPLTPHSSIVTAAHPSFIWLRRLLLATWWVDASKANSLAPLSPSLPPRVHYYPIRIVSASILIPIFVAILVFIASISLQFVLIYVTSALFHCCFHCTHSCCCCRVSCCYQSWHTFSLALHVQSGHWHSFLIALITLTIFYFAFFAWRFCRRQRLLQVGQILFCLPGKLKRSSNIFPEVLVNSNFCNTYYTAFNFSGGVRKI